MSRAYFQVLLRQKVNELTTEIANFRTESENLGRERSSHAQISQKQADLLARVKELEGRLADNNLALDKFRSGSKQEDLMPVINHLGFQNARLKHQLDEIFLERKALEDRRALLDQRVAELRAGAEIKLNELPPATREEFKRFE